MPSLSPFRFGGAGSVYQLIGHRPFAVTELDCVALLPWAAMVLKPLNLLLTVFFGGGQVANTLLKRMWFANALWVGRG